ncbi:MAG TPA: phage major capsid protein, partial [Coriobacteriia bacterium]
VPEPVHADFIDLMKKELPILALARFYDMTGADSVTIQRKTARAVSGGIVTETEARPTTAAATYEEVTLKAFEYYANPRASQLFLDSVANAEADIYADVRQALVEDYGADLINGVGSTTEPEGLLTGITAHTISGSDSTITNTGLHNLSFDLAAAYARNGKYLMRRATLGVLDTLAHPASANTPLVTWVGGVPYILGKEVLECEDMPAIGAGNFPVFFGDINQAYGCGVHRNWTMLRDPYTDKPFIHFYTIGRMGGVVRDVNAGRKLEITDDVS